ncbi:rRNA methyltransferase 1 mitochondrial [Phtheirospermum japonicum]|uniref:rRNA methyltransferase 1, mitochondrial n=1 Tax=Phtheirospermum japonicum TaxID=374723 RepID=A0A830BRP2_9LAMI|nr:rRNA methyltransferase 1 mitochondrial [Phtheirospermum japonicum]
MERERRKAVKNETSKGVVVRSSWEESAEKFLKSGSPAVEIKETHRNEFRHKKDNAGVEEGQDDEVANEPRWYNIKKRYENFAEAKRGPDRPEVRRWNKQEDWGRKTWNEAKDSTLPKIVGEGIYGVGPVLAALSSGRREFYALYVQEGLDLTTNNKKKKDKKGFEKILKMSHKIGLIKKEVSKHDLNMIVDNRPHQGLVLDASPLEMVGIKELDPVSVDGGGEKGPLWLALDEVTDPQNLGAIIRSAYYFGACGVVLCAKNSAPLSGVVSKASAGSLELMELRSCKNMMQFLASSAGNGWRVLGGSVSGRAVALSDVVPGEPTILVLGSEGTGLRPLVERSCTQLIRIPGNRPVDLVGNGDDEDVEGGEDTGREFRSFLAVESLNVSVAAGVMLNHLIG